MTRKRLVIGLTLGLLVSWFVLKTQESLEDEALYARQMLVVKDVQLVDQGELPPHGPLTDALEQAITPRLGHLADCLKTDEGSLAPAVLEVQVGPDGLNRSEMRCRGELGQDEQRCLDEALEKVEWPSSPQSSTVIFLLQTLAESDS